MPRRKGGRRSPLPPWQFLSDLFRACWTGEIGTRGETYPLPSLHLEKFSLDGQALSECEGARYCLLDVRIGYEYEMSKTRSLLDTIRRYFPDNGGFEEVDFLHVYGDPIQALLYSALFCPETVEVDGMVFLTLQVSDRDDVERVRRYLIDVEGNRQAVESSFNFVEVPYLFGASPSTDEDDLLLAERLADSWRAWLSYIHPDRQFVVEVLSPEVTGSVVGIHFFQDCPSPEEQT